MSKYEQINNNINEIKIESIISANETILWKGKPKRSTYIKYKKFNNVNVSILVFFAGIFIITMLSSIYYGYLGKFVKMLQTLIMSVFFFIPVLKNFYDGKKASQIWDSIEYIITNKRIIVKSLSVLNGIQTLAKDDIINIQLEKYDANKKDSAGNITFFTSVVKASSTV